MLSGGYSVPGAGRRPLLKAPGGQNLQDDPLW